MDSEGSIPLATLLQRLPHAQVKGDRSLLVTTIATTSQSAIPGAVFVALPGEHTDGHRYVAEAVRNGAGAVVVSLDHDVVTPASVTVVRVADTRRALSALSAAFYGDPSRHLDVIGITGTNGKTTTSHMIAAILAEGRIPCGIVGTVGARFGSQRWPLQNTTPQPPELQALLARMLREGAKAVTLEVSSHGLALDRVDDVAFCIAVLTNVTRDHLDFHKTMEAYAAAKRRLFGLAPICVLNLDDPYGARWALELANEGREVISYGSTSAANLIAGDVVLHGDGSRFIAGDQKYELRLLGRFNVWNALAAIAVAKRLGVDDVAIGRGLASLESVPGRMEHLRSSGIDIVVDYAHTPDALEHALTALRSTTDGALVVVFGCGGDRDKGKREEMGAIAARLADRAYLTNDNPRTEDPREIVAAIAAGMVTRKPVVELDRRRAIERAVEEARPGDAILIAGKGHERYQIVGDRVLPFDDAAAARAALSQRKGSQ